MQGGGGVIVSTNYGGNWTQTALSSDIHALIVYGNNIFAGGGGGFFVSTDNGTSWTQRIEGMPYYLLSLCISNNNVFAGTDGYGVWRRPLSELVGIEPISSIVPEDFKLFQYYPNPFNPLTKIKFDIPSNVKHQTSN